MQHSKARADQELPILSAPRSADSGTVFFQCADDKASNNDQSE